MSKFFVGQRVRMVATDEPEAQSCVGEETRIIGDRYDHQRETESWDLDNGWSVVKDNAGDFISPILPDGHRVGADTLPSGTKTD